MSPVLGSLIKPILAIIQHGGRLIGSFVTAIADRGYLFEVESWEIILRQFLRLHSKTYANLGRLLKCAQRFQLIWKQYRFLRGSM